MSVFPRIAAMEDYSLFWTKDKPIQCKRLGRFNQRRVKLNSQSGNEQKRVKPLGQTVEVHRL